MTTTPSLLNRLSSSAVVTSVPYRAVSAIPWIEPSSQPLPLLSPSSVRTAAQEAFQRADSSRSGAITLYEFRTAMRQLGFTLTDVSTISFFRAIDTENLGRVTLDQFVSWYSLNWKVLATMAIRDDGASSISLFERVSSTEAENRLLRDEVAQLKMKLNDALVRSAEVDTLSNRLYDASAENHAKRSQISDLNKQIGNLSAEAVEATRLRGELSATHETLTSVRNDLVDANATSNGLRKRVGELEGKVQLVEAALKSSETERLNALAEKEYVLGEKRALEVKIGALDSQLTERIIQLENSQRIEREYSLRLEAVEKERDDARQALTETGNLLRHAENKLGNALLAEQMLSDKLVSHETALKSLRDVLNNTSADLDRTHRSLIQSQENAAALRNEKQRLEAEGEGLKTSLANRLAELQESAIALNSERSNVAALEARVEMLKQDLAVSNETIIRYRSSLDDFQRRVPLLEATIGELQGKISASEKVIPNLQSAHHQIAQLEAALSELKSQYAQAKTTLDQIFALPDPCGVGLKIEEIKGEIQVSGFVEDMSALRSEAIGTGDVLRSVNDIDVAGMSVNQVRELILGPRGSYVKITLTRAGTSERFPVQLRRGSYGPEFQVVGSEVKDAPASFSGKPVDAPVSRRSLISHLVTM